MHIKRIVIQGFKTYKNTTVIDLLSPNHNVVVGRNGSGKSNFFAAIRFVLSDAYTHMTREERQGLIHEGSGTTVMSAYVEIIFDNTERRFPVAKDEVAIRRTIGLKKDDYSLDSKSASRSDVMNLLESAGFSRSNPYYIVPQGRITALTNSKDAERLSLLKEVSGAKVFETKLKDSLKEMNNSNMKRERIDETLKSIEERLSDLQIESSDLKEFQTYEKSKKVYEFNLFDRELNELNAQLEEINANYEELLLESNTDLEDLNKREKLGKQLLDSINELQRSLKLALLDREQSEGDYKQIVSVKTDLEIKLNELKSQLDQTKEQSSKFDVNLQHYQELITKREEDIAIYKPELENLLLKESQIKLKLNELQTRQRSLYSKQNRFSKFKTKTERDKWLKTQIKERKNELKLKEASGQDIQNQLTEKNQELDSKDEQISELNNFVMGDEFQTSVEVLQSSINELRTKITEITDHKKKLWRDEIRLRSIQDSLSNDLNNAKHSVNQTMDRMQASGLDAVKKISERLNLQDSVYGPLAELFSVNDKYKTAVEVVAGNSLFHIVVDTDKTASIIMDELVRTQMGRVTLIPLNRINPPSTVEVNDDESGCFPLIKKLKYKDERIAPALRQVFRKTLLVIDLEKGTELAKRYNVSCITLDGDRADNRGVLTGGYRDYKKSSSRIDALKTLAKKKLEFEENEKLLNECVQEIEKINPQLISLNNELQQKISEQDDKISSLEPIKAEISKLSDIKFNLMQEIDTLNKSSSSIQSQAEAIRINLQQHEQELESEFVQTLSSAEQEELAGLSSEIIGTESELDGVVTELADLEAKVSTFQSELVNNYYPYVAKLKRDHDKGDSSVIVKLQFEIQTLENDLANVQVELDTAASSNKSTLETYKKLEKEVETNEELLKKAKKQQQQIVKKLEKFQESTEKELSKKSVLLGRREEVQRKIRDLGVLPEEAFQQEKYDKFNSEDLLKKLNKVNEKLVKYSHINRKAMEQYSTFTKQRDDLVERLEDLEKSRESIESLIVDLESQKDEAITKSFQEVGDSFTKIFEKLVPAGTGRLIMQKAPANESGSVTSTQTPKSQEIENYTGVSISVSFNSKSDEQQKIEQLSGGQKSLCAIALILAIQNCDPAPFYLFDEIDANLDTQYRIAVAAMIHSLSSKAQFICTTFRPEMLQVADKFYGVIFNNKVSSVSEINQEEAMSFIEGQKVN